jgi:hypothetical protein
MQQLRAPQARSLFSLMSLSDVSYYPAIKDGLEIRLRGFAIHA